MSTDLSDFFNVLTNLFLIMFVVGSMLSLGLGLTINQILDPLKNVWFVVLALVANFVLVPALGWAIAEVFQLDDSLTTGLIIVAAVAGAPFLPKLVQMAKGDVPSAVALMVLIMVVTIAYAPIVIPMLVPGASVDAWAIAKPLLVMMLLPLAIGLFVKARWQAVADEIIGPVAQISNIGLVGVVVLLVALNFSSVMSLIGTRGILAAILFTVGAFLIGWFVSEKGRSARSVMGLGTGQRNLAAAMTVATANFASDPNVTAMVVVTALIIIIAMLAAGGELGRHAEKPA